MWAAPLKPRAMRKVAGLSKAGYGISFRELEAFAAFGSDLDKATLKQIDRGRRLVEILKQPQFHPMTAEKEVAILFAGSNGFLDKWPISAVADYEKQMLEFMSSKYAGILADIKGKR